MGRVFHFSLKAGIVDYLLIVRNRTEDMMVKMHWVITSDLSKITLDEFDNEWNGAVYGFFELCINNRKEGIWPNKTEMDALIEIGMADMEDILYWFVHLKEGINAVKKNKEYEMQLLTMNRYSLKMKLKHELYLKFINIETGENNWDERVELEEFENELYVNIEKFLNYIKRTNSRLLKSKWIEELLL